MSNPFIYGQHEIEALRKDAERWRKARRIFACEDIERAADEMRGGDCLEEENVKADAAIDAVQS